MRFLVKTSIFLLILFLIAFFSANYVLRKLAAKALVEIKPRLEQKGIMIKNFNYNTIILNSYNSCAVNDIDLEFYLNKKMYGANSFKATFNAKSITVRFADFNDPSFFFTFQDFSLFVEPEKKSIKRPFGKLENGYLKSRIPIKLTDPEESAKEILTEIKTLFRENKSPMDLEIKVDALLGIDDKEVKVGLYTERIDAETCLKFDEDDIFNASKVFDFKLSKKEAEIIANHPSKVPALIKITRDARRLSAFEKDKDSSFPEDAYKHLYWSYQLTREFGPDLAKEITDAHETIPNNTLNERKMDFHNNEVGRKYAGEKLSSHELKNRVLYSDEIIRSPNEVM